MSDRRNHMTGDAWGNDIHSNAERAALPPKATPDDIARAIDKARREGYAAGVRAAAEVADTVGVYPELNVWGGGPDWYKHARRIARAIRALDGKGDGV